MRISAKFDGDGLWIQLIPENKSEETLLGLCKDYKEYAIYVDEKWQTYTQPEIRGVKFHMKPKDLGR